jgi:hypothetical protein
MSEETVQQGTAYWMTGQTPGTSSGSKTQFKNPTGLAIDKAQRLYISDSSNARIVRLHNMWYSTNFSSIPVGTGFATFNGNGDLAAETSLAYPTGLALNNDGALLFADTGAHDIRQVLGITWNLPCAQSAEYHRKLTAPSAQDIKAAETAQSCRLAQVRSIVLNQIKLCVKCAMAASNFQWTEECSSSMFKSLCSSPASTSTSETASLLEKELKGLPDCSGCPLQYGCDLPESGLVWNETLNEDNETKGDNDNDAGPAGDSAPFEMMRLLSDSAASMALQAVQMMKANQAQPSDWAAVTGLKDKINACVNATGLAPLKAAISALQLKLCQGYSAGLFHARILFHEWYTYVSDVCVVVPDNPQVERAAHLGAQFYNEYSEMVTRLFWHNFDAMQSKWSPSTCQPRCNIMHPRFFLTANWRNLQITDRSGSIRLPDVRGKCCGLQNNGLLCKVGEGPCQLNSDCESGLVCGMKNCLWSKSENCCSTPEPSEGHARLQDFSRATGFTKLANLWWKNS